ncbi:radical SAM protein [Streptomyces sp. NPDC001536]|uniref:radical SAM protein n=1 Tax=Streptomyces sp. NPDC001536 TaxID=3364583 RepID=UPI003680F446
MSKPEADPVYVRASVWPKCDLVCHYCPVEEGMENRVPKRFAGERLSTSEYIRNLAAIARAGVRGVSFTGGEPTLRPDLPDIIRAVRPMFDRVELTTNGARLPKMTDAVKENIDLLKVSLDSVDTGQVALITGRRFAFDHARTSIQWAVAEEVPLALNAVLMRRTYANLDRTIDFVRGLVQDAKAPVHLSLLDFYYSPSRHSEWTEDFLPTNGVLDLLTTRYGAPEVQDRFGCRFYWFDADGFSVRLKDSYSATMRAPKCQGCTSYCQEGVYGIKHSVEGWLTTCPSDREDLGTLLAPSLSDAELTDRVRLALRDIEDAVPVDDSFDILCATHGLTPQAA